MSSLLLALLSVHSDQKLVQILNNEGTHSTRKLSFLTGVEATREIIAKIPRFPTNTPSPHITQFSLEWFPLMQILAFVCASVGIPH